MAPPDEVLLSSIATLLRQTQHLAMLTGAGISAESGIPTLRDALTGLWQQFDAEDLATPNAFLRNKALVWGLVRRATPENHASQTQCRAFSAGRTDPTDSAQHAHYAKCRRLARIGRSSERPLSARQPVYSALLCLCPPLCLS